MKNNFSPIVAALLLLVLLLVLNFGLFQLNSKFPKAAQADQYVCVGGEDGIGGEVNLVGQGGINLGSLTPAGYAFETGGNNFLEGSVIGDHNWRLLEGGGEIVGMPRPFSSSNRTVSAAPFPMTTPLLSAPTAPTVPRAPVTTPRPVVTPPITPPIPSRFGFFSKCYRLGSRGLGALGKIAGAVSGVMILNAVVTNPDITDEGFMRYLMAIYKTACGGKSELVTRSSLFTQRALLGNLTMPTDAEVAEFLNSLKTGAYINVSPLDQPKLFEELANTCGNLFFNLSKGAGENAERFRRILNSFPASLIELGTPYVGSSELVALRNELRIKLIDLTTAENDLMVWRDVTIEPLRTIYDIRVRNRIDSYENLLNALLDFTRLIPIRLPLGMTRRDAIILVDNYLKELNRRLNRNLSLEGEVSNLEDKIEKKEVEEVQNALLRVEGIKASVEEFTIVP